jgi:hypothetical protein
LRIVTISLTPLKAKSFRITVNAFTIWKRSEGTLEFASKIDFNKNENATLG